jgi:drug/metabolite transporter (DMT)-like permease
MRLSDNLRGVLFMNVAMLAFTVNDTFMKALTTTMPLFQAITLRGIVTTFGLIVIGLILNKQINLSPQKEDRWPLFIRTIAEVGGTVFFLAALRHMPLANLSAIMQSLPLAVTLIAALFMGERVGWRRMIAIAVGFVGVMIIIRPGTDSFDIWSIMGLCSVACVVVRDLATRRISQKMPSVSVAIWAASCVTLMGLCGLLVEGTRAVTFQDVQLVLGASAALIIGYLFVVMVMRVGDIGFVAPFRYTALLWAIVIGYVLFGAFPDQWTLLGAAIVVATGAYTLWRERILSA